MKVTLFNQTDQDISFYESTLHHVFSHVEGDASVNIIFISNQDMIALNKQYRKLNKTTDVLTFPSDFEAFETMGDIFINIIKVKEQAESFGHSEAREVAFLAVHGYLHILGYDHHKEDDEKKMILAQETILKRAGLERI
jgi:probable rRNA maturation factor